MQLAFLPPALVALLPMVLAAPLDSRSPITVTTAQLQSIAPNSASCKGSGQYASECQTAAGAAGAISASFATYGISTPGAAAAVIATMAFESGEFEYAVHHFPTPNPGQGTRNMQSAKYNLQYAQSIPALASELPAAQAKGPDAILSMLIQYKDIDFGSAAWFMKTNCAPSVMSGLASGTTEAFGAWVTCYGGTLSSKLTTYFTNGVAALKSS
ncbi:hypothetical protein P7C71_g501, partial [Lecanoromycetidae sp. Uapishka_2]